MAAMDPVALLREMLEVESLSGQEAYLGALLIRRMSELGLEASIDLAGNAVGVRTPALTDEATTAVSAEVTAEEPKREIVLLGHMDTVPGRIPVRLEDGRLHGRGAVDAKGPLAAFIVAAASAALRPGARVVVVGAVEEEVPSSRGAHFALARYRPHACIVGEPSGWDSVTLGYKGRLVARYAAERPVGHSAGPVTTAAEEAVRWWLDIRDAAAQASAGRDSLFEQVIPTLQSIRTEADGLHERAEVIVGLRLPPDVDLEALQAELARLAGDAQVSFAGYVTAFRAPRDTPLVRAFQRAIRHRGGRPAFKLKTGTSDMNLVGPAWDCPIVAYGPGDSRLDHTPHEHIAVDEYLRAVEVLKEVLEAL